MTRSGLSQKLAYMGALLSCLLLSGATWILWLRPVAKRASGLYLQDSVGYPWTNQFQVLLAVSTWVTVLSYIAIACSLAWLAYGERRHTPFNGIFAAFGLICAARGITLAMEQVALRVSLYRFSGYMSLLAAIAWLSAAASLSFLAPKILKVLQDARDSRINEQRFLAASDGSSDAFYIFESVRDKSGEIVDFRFAFSNQRGARLVSLTPESLAIVLLCEYLPFNGTEGHFERYKRVVETGESLDTEFPIDSPDVLCSRVHCRVVKLEDGVAITTSDISASKESELRREEADSHFRTLVEGVQEHALFTVDTEDRITSWNLGAERMLGYDEAEILGRKASCFYTPEEIQNHVPEARFKEAMQTGRVEHEGWRVRANGEKFWAAVNKTALRGEGPTPGAGTYCPAEIQRI